MSSRLSADNRHLRESSRVNGANIAGTFEYYRSHNGRPTLFVVDADDAARSSLMRRLGTAGWYVEPYGSAHDFLRRAPYTDIGCALLEVQLPDMRGTDLQVEMMARGIILPIVFLTAQSDVPTAVGAMKRGAVDFLVKPVDRDTLLKTIRVAIERHVAERDSYLHGHANAERLASMSSRQREVLIMVAAGYLNKEIAAQMGVTIQTVKVHRAKAIAKAGVRSVAELVHFCSAMHLSIPRQRVDETAD
jgi:FixJ family two-component response regulator